jgi:hypothetical protein
MNKISFQNTTLRAVATLSFSKFLCVSSQFCDAHHRLLFRVLETSRDANIRSNIAIALGDVVVSFNTIIDENSDELYRGLSDSELVVKKNTLMVLTHLILNGMIKVKGQLGEMAKCLEDKEPRIADLAKLFFTELSTKDNAIYNNLPDGALPSPFLFTFPFHERARAPRAHARHGVLFFLSKVEADTSDYAQSSAISQLANTRWTKTVSKARCGTSSNSSKRRSKRKASSKSSASVSDCRRTRDSGATSRSAYPYFRSNRSGR